MAFWGVEVKGGSSYTHSFDRDQGRLHLSQATLGSGSSNKKSILQCTVGDKKPIYLCSLLPEKLETCQLNHEFEEEDDVVFSVIGPHSIHLSGFFFGESHDCGEDHYGSDSSGEDITNTDSDEYSDFDSEDEDEEDDPFFTDNLDMSPSPVPNSGVVIEEIVEDDKPAADAASKRGKKKKKSGTSDVNGNSDRQIVVKNTAGGSILESEDEDGFPVSSPPKNKADAPEAKKMEENTAKKKTKDESGQGRSLKRKVDAVVQDEEESRKTDEQSSLTHPEAAALETDVKQKKGKKNKKLKGKEDKSSNLSASANVNIEQTRPQDNDQKSTTDKNGEIQADSVVEGTKKKKNKKNKKKGNETEVAVEPTATEQKAVKVKSDNKEAEPFQVRSFPNGLTIEELKMGKPDGKKAAPGKKVSVHYIGKLKKNGKIFDSNIGSAPFKFRLGVGQVIKGWDVGVNGMRVGDKRRITIPPAMGYGAGGAGAAIPPNSWLVFDVELVGVN